MKRWMMGAMALAGHAAVAAPAPLTTNPYAPIVSGGITVRLSPLTSVPADAPGSALARITTVVNDGTGRLFVSDLNGTIYRTDAAGSTPVPYLDLRTQGIGTPAPSGFYGVGLSGVAFHPNFAGDPAKPGYGMFYTTAYTTASGPATIGGTGPITVEIREWSATNPAAPTFTGASRSVLTIGGYQDDHSNGFIGFNPNAKPGTADYGKLYIGSGDGLYNDGNRNAQNLAVPQGKMLRIDPLASDGQPYTVPADNPYAGQAGKLGEVWASGLRFPQSFSWDTAGTGQLFINDIGQAFFEEVDLGQKGANYGWSERQGPFATGYAYGLVNENAYPVPPGTAGFTDPIAGYSHYEGAALGSGFVYRGSAIPDLYGKYVLQDIVTGRLFYFDPAAASPGTLAPLYQLDLTTDLYSQYYPRADTRLADPLGELLLISKQDGSISQLAEVISVPEPRTIALLAGLCFVLAMVRRRS